MNQKEEMLARAGAALAVPAVVDFIRSLRTLAPENIAGWAKEMRDKVGLGQSWEKSIVDLARLARDYPEEFSAAVQEAAMKKQALIKRFTLTPEFIRFGYATIVNIAGFECGLRVKAIGSGRDSYDDLLGSKVETDKKDSYTFIPHFDVDFFPPSTTKEELQTIIAYFGKFRFPNKRESIVSIDGHELRIEHSPGREEEFPHHFHNWLTSTRWLGLAEGEKYPWEDELDNFCFHIRFEVWRTQGYDQGKDGMIPEYFKSRDFRLKIILHCLREYFGLSVKF